MTIFNTITLPTLSNNFPYYRYSIGSSGFKADGGDSFGNIKNRSSVNDLAAYCGEIRTLLGGPSGNKRCIIKLSSLNLTALPSGVENFYSNNYYLNIGSIPTLNNQSTFQSLNLNITNNIGLSNTIIRTASNIELTIKDICDNILNSQGYNNNYLSFNTQSYYNKVLQIRVIANSSTGSIYNTNTELFRFNTGTFDQQFPTGSMKLILSYNVVQNKPSNWVSDSIWFKDYTIEFYGITDPNAYAGLDLTNTILQIAPGGITETKLITYILAGNTAKVGAKFLPVGLSTTHLIKSLKTGALIPASIGYRIQPNTANVAPSTIFVGMALPGDSNLNGGFEDGDVISGQDATPIASTSPRNNWLKGDYNFDNNYNTRDKILSNKLTNNFSIKQRYISTLNLPGSKTIPFNDQYRVYSNLSPFDTFNTDPLLLNKNWALLRCSLPFLTQH